MNVFTCKNVRKVMSSPVLRRRILILCCLFLFSFPANAFSDPHDIGGPPSLIERVITGIVTDEKNSPLPGVTVKNKGFSGGVITGTDGKFKIRINEPAILVFSFVGYIIKEVPVSADNDIKVVLREDLSALNDVVVIGYGTKKRGDLTGAIATISAEDIGDTHGGTTVSSTLAGKLAGVTFRQSEGRPGATASIQIRNMGTPLYVIDDIQQDEGRFNNLSPNDIESITVLKDAAAAVYGVQAANGVVVVTTKKGTPGRNNVNVDTYKGFQIMGRFPHVLTNTADYLFYEAEAEMNSNNTTSITPEVLDLAKAGTDPQYRSFDWRSFVINNNYAPQNSVNVNVNGGSDKVTYYVSATHQYQEATIGEDYNYKRSNLQSNLTAKLANGLKAGFDISGRLQTTSNPGLSGGDDYSKAKESILRLTPMDRPFANDNPAYPADLGTNTLWNYAFLNDELGGRNTIDARMMQANFHLDYAVPYVKGLSFRGLGSYSFYDLLNDNFEYSLDAYTYNPSSDTYRITGGTSRRWREREQMKLIRTNVQLQANYNISIGRHNLSASMVMDRTTEANTRNYVHANPVSNSVSLINYSIVDTYDDSRYNDARIGFVGKLSYKFANRYFIDASVRRDASSLFAPDKRIGYFPGVTAAWRLTEEKFIKNLLGERGSKILSDLKIRASYGILGDDRGVVDRFAYLSGYSYLSTSTPAILDGTAVTTSRDKGVPVTSVSWTKSRTSNIGVDFSLFEGRITGSYENYYRERTGLVGNPNNVTLPMEVGFALANQNVNSDANFGQEISLFYRGSLNKLKYNFGGNFSFAQTKWVSSPNPRYFNSLDEYRYSTNDRLSNFAWGKTMIGQFTSQQQIYDYPVNIDGQGNKTLLPGDFIFEDVNGDGKIDGLDDRPVGYNTGTQPIFNFGFTIGLNYSNFDFRVDFSGASGYAWNQNFEQRFPFYNNGNLNSIFTDRWHRENIYDPNSAWIPGKYPANRYNPTGGSNYMVNSYWYHHVTQLRIRTLQLGYSIPAALLKKVKIQKARFYINTYNLFSFDNLKKYDVDPETVDQNGLQIPQNKVVNIGVNLSF
ncbi:SusC/RagA family TonB-linked outer membrane protein [Pedobacter miscanthi]|uniref:SusC/RagA family TonB-linked outer membrane protein n=1 Tax=Pedobacter miscanthi TaxID=2259170 RepID=UPI0029317E83|nr:SusC/RagA family TonB-linked outer membrane protein [Pedobacter miscanthi]